MMPKREGERGQQSGVEREGVSSRKAAGVAAAPRMQAVIMPSGCTPSLCVAGAGSTDVSTAVQAERYTHQHAGRQRQQREQANQAHSQQASAP